MSDHHQPVASFSLRFAEKQGKKIAKKRLKIEVFSASDFSMNWHPGSTLFYPKPPLHGASKSPKPKRPSPRSGSHGKSTPATPFSKRCTEPQAPSTGSTSKSSASKQQTSCGVSPPRSPKTPESFPVLTPPGPPKPTCAASKHGKTLWFEQGEC